MFNYSEGFLKVIEQAKMELYGKSKEEITRDVIIDAIDCYSEFCAKRFEIKLSDDEKKKMLRQLEYEFSVSMIEDDIMLLSAELQRHHSTWWTDSKERRKAENKNYYRDSFYKFLINDENFQKDEIERIEERADKILDKLYDPCNPDIQSVDRRGVVVGHVQSGKTANYSALICKAADAGFKVIIVIAGIHSILRQQTQERLTDYFVGAKEEKEPHEDDRIGVGRYRSKNVEDFEKRKPICLTDSKTDFKSTSRRALECVNFNNTTAPILLVIKKNQSILNEVDKWLKRLSSNGHSLLLIDDEADNASVNAGKKATDPTKINKQIRQILKRFSKSAYVGYTATPFANIFIDPLTEHADVGADLYPKDFILALQSPQKYIGAEKIFGDEELSSEVLVKIDDWEEAFPVTQRKDEIDDYCNELPDSLKDAIRLFLMNVAVRNLRGFRNKHNSMLVHASRFSMMHQKIKEKIIDFLDEFNCNFYKYSRVSSKSPEWQQWIKPLKDVYELELLSGWGQKEEYGCFDWDDILSELEKCYNTVEVKASYTNNREIEYKKDEQTNVIAIGGNSLARGFTLVNLSVSYFIRNTVMCDTLLQMGRWFGYRYHFDDLCRVFIPNAYAENFHFATMSSLDLVGKIGYMEKQRATPMDFLLTVSEHPASRMLLTARNKMINAERDKGVRLDGKLSENGNIYVDSLDKARKDVAKLISSLGSPSLNPLGDENLTNYFWTGVDANMIAAFISHYPYPASTSFGMDYFCSYIKKNNHLDWDVVLVSTKSGNETIFGGLKVRKPKRCYKDDSTNNLKKMSVSGKSDEFTGLTTKAYVDNNLQSDDLKRKDMRIVRGVPLLIINIVDGYNKDFNTPVDIEDIPLLSVSFPGSFTNPVMEAVKGISFNKIVSEMLKTEQEELDEELESLELEEAL